MKLFEILITNQSGAVSVQSHQRTAHNKLLDHRQPIRGHHHQVKWNVKLPTNQGAFLRQVAKKQPLHKIEQIQISNQSGAVARPSPTNQRSSPPSEMSSCQPIRSGFFHKWPRNSRCIKLSKFKSRTNQGPLLGHRQRIGGRVWFSFASLVVFFYCLILFISFRFFLLVFLFAGNEGGGPPGQGRRPCRIAAPRRESGGVDARNRPSAQRIQVFAFLPIAPIGLVRNSVSLLLIADREHDQ